MSTVFAYLDGEYRFIETEYEEDEARRVEDSVNSGRCASCGKRIADWSVDVDRFCDITMEYPLPVNVCYKCGKRVFEEGRF